MDIKPISDLLGYKFIIPPYQRGYRWDSEQINALLEDFKEFADNNYNKEQSFYCLQPIVVVPEKGKNDTFIVVDGQQRLTTIYLILKYLNKKMGSHSNLILELPGRDIQESFLNNCTFANNADQTYKDNIDNFYLRKAYDTIV